MSMTTELAQREKFEAWAEECCALPWGYLKERRTYSGNYSEHTYTSLWGAWKAACEGMVEALEARDKQIAELSGIISSARKFTSKCAGFGDVGAAEFIKIIDRATGVAVEGE
ncbi:hypothetical protein [Escherichia coli]|uniref:hypothetical protein n=1 Tax=Escherichia coli TaxID=562 RepID=UPI00200EC52A|nr:hypothetical protein [Escherichia coli]